MKKLTFTQWHTERYGESWGDRRKDLFLSGFDKNTVDNIIKDGLEDEYKTALKSQQGV